MKCILGRLFQRKVDWRKEKLNKEKKKNLFFNGLTKMNYGICRRMIAEEGRKSKFQKLSGDAAKRLGQLTRLRAKEGKVQYRS